MNTQQAGNLNSSQASQGQRLICPKCNVVVEDSLGPNRGGKCALGHRLERATGTFPGFFIAGASIGTIASLLWYVAPPPGILGTGLGFIQICLAGGGVIAIGQGLVYLFKPQPTKSLGAPRLGMGLGWSVGTAGVLYLLWKYHAIWAGGGGFVGIVGLMLGLGGAIWIVVSALRHKR